VRIKLILTMLVLAVLLALPANASASFSAKQFRANMIAYINKYRVNHGLRRLRVAPRLQTAAQAHSNNMARYRLFSHTSSNGTGWAARIRYFGYRCPYLGENLAVGQITPRQTLRMWVHSPMHRAVLSKGVFRGVGIGVARGSYSGRLSKYVTADFGGGC
jgi:uncharacterized protein YkwD